MCLTREFEDPVTRSLRALHHPILAQKPQHSRGLYLATNESGVEQIRVQLQQVPLVANGCHLGVSGFYNLDLIALRRSAYGIIVDLNPAVRVFMEMTLYILRTESNREQVIKKLADYEATTDLSVCLGSQLPEMWFGRVILYESTRVGSWMATEETFSYIQQQARQDRIAVLNEDLLHTETFLKSYKVMVWSWILYIQVMSVNVYV